MTLNRIVHELHRKKKHFFALKATPSAEIIYVKFSYIFYYHAVITLISDYVYYDDYANNHEI